MASQASHSSGCSPHCCAQVTALSACPGRATCRLGLFPLPATRQSGLWANLLPGLGDTGQVGHCLFFQEVPGGLAPSCCVQNCPGTHQCPLVASSQVLVPPSREPHVVLQVSPMRAPWPSVGPWLAARHHPHPAWSQPPLMSRRGACSLPWGPGAPRHSIHLCWHSLGTQDLRPLPTSSPPVPGSLGPPRVCFLTWARATFPLTWASQTPRVTPREESCSPSRLVRAAPSSPPPPNTAPWPAESAGLATGRTAESVAGGSACQPEPPV